MSAGTSVASAQPDSGLRVYLALLRIPHAARSAVSGVIGQFPFPFLGMGLLIGIRDGYGSYTLAGTVSAVMAITSAVTGPVVGRLIDTHGQRRVGLPLSAFWVSSVLFMGAAIHFHWPPALMLAGAVLLGTSVPYSSMIRGRWTYVLRDQPGRLNSALSLTSMMEELMWVIGNPLGTVLATSVAVLSPLAAAIIAIIVAGAGFLLDTTLEPPVAASRPADQAADAVSAAQAAQPSQPGQAAQPSRSAQAADAGCTHLVSDPAPAAQVTEPDPSGQASNTAPAAARSGRVPLLTVGFVSLLAIEVFYGAFIASTNISVLALAQEVGMPGRAGFVIAAFSGASMIGAIGYGARTWESPLWVRFYVGMVIVAAGSSFLLLSSSLPAAAGILFVAGLAQAPTVVNVNQLLIRMTPPQRFTEAMALLGAMFVVGMAVSNFVTGWMVDRAGSHGGFLTLAGFAATALVIGVIAMRPIRRATSVHFIHDVSRLVSDAH